MAGKTSGKSAVAYYANYKSSGKYAKNRKKKLERQLKLQPNNEKQIITAMANVGSYRRATPINPKWSSTNIRELEIKRLFTKGNVKELKWDNKSFTLGARVHWGT